MRTKIYVTKKDNGSDIFETGYFLTSTDASEQMERDYNHLTARERKMYNLYAEAYFVEHEEVLLVDNIEAVFANWSEEQCWMPDPVEVINYGEY